MNKETLNVLFLTVKDTEIGFTQEVGTNTQTNLVFSSTLFALSALACSKKEQSTFKASLSVQLSQF